MKQHIATFLFLATSCVLVAQDATPVESAGKIADKPLYRDPVYDGAADPVVVWNPHVRKWWMFYTNRRANAPGLSGVAWVHGTRIGIAESADGGATWSYVGTADIELPKDIGGDQPTQWAPEVFTSPDGLHHMLLTVVPGIFQDWRHPRTIVHLTSNDLRHWSRAVPLQLASDRVIDACVFHLPDGTWRMWYNNERDGKSIYYADSPDLKSWTDKGKARGTSERGGEGPKVFRWKGHYWMAVDIWDGLRIYRSDDALNWKRQQEQLLQQPGHGNDDQVKGGHPDVVVSDGRAYLFYFTHPGRRGEDARKDGYEQRRSSIQVVELNYKDGWLTCDRDQPTHIRLVPPAADVDQATMQRIYDEAKTPFKYGIVIEPPEGKKVDCPNVFRYGDKWFMMYVQLENEPKGYTTQLAESDDLLHWKPLGTVLPRGASNAWDAANAGGGVALFDTTWGGSNTLHTYDGHYWLSYLGGPNPGYEQLPISIGIAFTDDPSQPKPWHKLPGPVLRHDDSNARAFESDVLYKSYILRDPEETLGAPFVMYYNARPPKGDETIGMALSHDMKTWKRYGDGPVIANARRPGATYGVISGDPQVVRMHGIWVMFYFGAFWKEGAFDTFAASHDLVHWTKWKGADLVRASEPWDTPFAHKPWLIKHDGVVYHFYCAVGGKPQHRTIALATSKDLRKTGSD